jgi:GNAT superfamily N-acetyltransferase
MVLRIKQEKKLNDYGLFSKGLILDGLYDDDQYIGNCQRKIIGNCLWIDMFQIDDSLRSRGYGRGFIKEYERFARKNGCNKIECKPNPGIEIFWEKVGFKKVRRKIIFTKFPPRLTDKIYRKEF